MNEDNLFQYKMNCLPKIMVELGQMSFFVDYIENFYVHEKKTLFMYKITLHINFNYTFSFIS